MGKEASTPTRRLAKFPRFRVSNQNAEGEKTEAAASFSLWDDTPGQPCLGSFVAYLSF